MAMDKNYRKFVAEFYFHYVVFEYAGNNWHRFLVQNNVPRRSNGSLAALVTIFFPFGTQFSKLCNTMQSREI